MNKIELNRSVRSSDRFATMETTEFSLEYYRHLFISRGYDIRTM